VGILLGGKPRQATPPDISGKFGNFLTRCNPATFATRQRAFGLIDRDQHFQAAPLTVFPQAKGFFHRAFLAPDPSAIDSLADKRPLVGVSCTSISSR
jgi:hypothetical protein